MSICVHTHMHGLCRNTHTLYPFTEYLRNDTTVSLSTPQAQIAASKDKLSLKKQDSREKWLAPGLSEGTPRRSLGSSLCQKEGWECDRDKMEGTEESL